MAHGALVLLPLLSLELPMLQAFWLLARGVGEGPASPFQPDWEGRIAGEIRRKALLATMSAAPSPRQMALLRRITGSAARGMDLVKYHQNVFPNNVIFR